MTVAKGSAPPGKGGTRAQEKDTGITLGEAVSAFLATLATRATERTYAQALKPMRDHFGADTALDGLTPAAVRDWLAATWGQKSAGTQNLRRRIVRSASAWWISQGWITRDLAPEGSVRARAALPAEIFTPAEVGAILDRCSRRAPTGVRNRALVMLLYRSGLRLGEALAIRPADIDPDARSIRLLATKSGQAQTRYYHHTAGDALSAWLNRRRQLGINGRAPVFCTLKGAPLSDRYVRDMLKRYAARAGIDKRVYPHEFRHTFAGELEAQGAHITEISKLLGHSDVAVTARYLASLTNHQAGMALGRITLPATPEDGHCPSCGYRHESLACPGITRGTRAQRAVAECPCPECGAEPGTACQRVPGTPGRARVLKNPHAGRTALVAG